MSEALFHPPAERLEAYAAGELDAGDVAVLESHLLDCGRCRLEVEEWRALFGALSDLPEMAPAAGFSERVMARVQIRRPLAVRVDALVGRLVPRTAKGWALAGAALGLPTLVMGMVMAWIASQPWLSISAVLGFGLQRVGTALASLPGALLSLASRTGVGLWITDAVQRLAAGGLAPFGVALGVFAALTVISAVVLYQNLFRTPSRGERHYARFFV